jgi:hypothetical protein
MNSVGRFRPGHAKSRHCPSRLSSGNLPRKLVLLPAAVAFLGLNVWVLVTSLRSGVYRLRGGGQRTPGSTAPQGQPWSLH